MIMIMISAVAKLLIAVINYKTQDFVVVYCVAEKSEDSDDKERMA